MPILRPSRLLILLAAALLTHVASGQDWAKSRLEASPRHHEYATLHHGDRTLQAFVVYPEIKQKATVVVLIHEIFGLTDWAKEMADELAGEGYIVIAPDLLSGSGPNGAGSEAFPTQDAAVKAVSALPPDQVLADLDAAASYGKTLPAASGKLTVAGFCWGGSKSFSFAAHRHDLAAAFVFYGSAPDDVSAITVPVFGFYAGNDARIDATLPATIEAMKDAGKRFEPVTYDGAGHGFMRAGEDPTAATSDTAAANKKARQQALARLIAQLKRIDAAEAQAASARLKKPSRVAKAVPASHPQCRQEAARSAAM